MTNPETERSYYLALDARRTHERNIKRYGKDAPETVASRDALLEATTAYAVALNASCATWGEEEPEGEQ